MIMTGPRRQCRPTGCGRRLLPHAQAATFPAGSDERSVAENSPAGTNVGDPVKANDTADEVLTYSLTVNEAGFQINPATAQITVGPRTDDEPRGRMARKALTTSW